MILVRDIFQLKFGKAREALALWKEGKELLQSVGHNPDRIMTDLVSTYYTLVLETTFNDLADMEASLQKAFSNEKYERWYQKFIPLVESGHREIFKLVE